MVMPYSKVLLDTRPVTMPTMPPPIMPVAPLTEALTVQPSMTAIELPSLLTDTAAMPPM